MPYINGVVYIGSDQYPDGHLYAFPAACSNPCAPLWTVTTELGVSAPAVANGVVYVGTGNRLLALPASCSNPCTPLWQAPGPGDTRSSPAVANGVVYFVDSGGTVYALSR